MQTIKLTIQSTRTEEFLIPDGADPDTVLERYVELADGETIVAADVDGVSAANPNVFTRPRGEKR